MRCKGARDIVIRALCELENYTCGNFIICVFTPQKYNFRSSRGEFTGKKYYIHTYF